MLKGIYSNSAYGRMRDRQAEREKQLKETDEKKKFVVPYRTLLNL